MHGSIGQKQCHWKLFKFFPCLTRFRLRAEKLHLADGTKEREGMEGEKGAHQLSLPLPPQPAGGHLLGPHHPRGGSANTTIPKTHRPGMNEPKEPPTHPHSPL